MCYFVIFKYTACEGYQNGHEKGIPQKRCKDPSCKPKVQEVPGFCPECIKISMRDDSSNDGEAKTRIKQKSKQAKRFILPVVGRPGQRVRYDEAVRRKLQYGEMDDQRAIRTEIAILTPTSGHGSGEKRRASLGYGGYESRGQVRRPTGLCGGYAYEEGTTARIIHEIGMSEPRSSRKRLGIFGYLLKQI
ncbi:hypothetical protein TWF694_007693 [Orbilia ellipsospora]|uniref:Uncharacterized protein n=1 Tax=Orbilia ellipsospora TaxID=2528407 RepID=A0AAV9XJZ5_9PEZI